MIRSITHKLLACFALVAAATVVTALLLHVLLTVLEGDQRASADSREALTVLEGIAGAIIVQDGAVGRYILSLDAATLEPFRGSGLDSYTRSVGQLRTLKAGDTAQLGRIAALDGAVGAWREAARDDVKRMTVTEASRKAMAVVRELLAEIRRVERETVATRSAAIDTAFAATSRAAMAGSALALVVAIGAWVFAARHLARPLVRLTGTMRRLAEGELDTAVPDTGRRDEIGAMARALEVFKANAVERGRLEAGRAAAERHRAEEKAALLRGLATRFQNSVGQAVAELIGSAETMRGGAADLIELVTRTDGQAGAIARSADAVSAHMQVVAGGAEELAASIAEVDTQIARAAGASDDAPPVPRPPTTPRGTWPWWPNRSAS
ncbi:HAMP domain-containing protein [Azospirillum oleiclasticum]|nr:HAMP domain-containing protein [Azospirillum oleiclasticum]